jgi:hypothetical protein
MATRKNPTSGGRRTTASNPGQNPTTKSDEFNLPAEPEATRQSRSATSNPGRDPVGGAAARAARERAYTENAMRRESNPSQNAPRSKRAVGIGAMSLLGGAGLGAVLMYLLDPEAGQERRENVKSLASRAAERSSDVLHNAWDMASEKLSPLADRASEIGASGMATASSLSSRLADRAGDAADSLRKGARRQMRSARDTASGWFGHEEERSYVPRASTALSAAAALAVGVGAMYLLDPTDGARRRALIRDKTTHWLNEAGGFFRATGKRLRNRSRGIAHEAQGMFQRDDVSDQQLAERIRSRIGHLGQQSTVNVATFNGRATITGRCTPSDLDALLTTVQGTPGVSSIVNLLDVRSENETAGLGGTTSAPTGI